MEKILLLLISIFTVRSVLEIDRISEYTAEDFKVDPLLRVIQTSSHLNNLSHYQSQYFIYGVQHRHKNRAYGLFQNRFFKIISLLKHLHVIPNESTLVKSKVKSRYINRLRVWEFSIVFSIQIPSRDHSKMVKKMESFGCKILQNSPDIKYLEQKLFAMRVFISAKARVEELLLSIDPQLEIVDVVDLDVNGLKGFEQSQQIESQLEDEVSADDSFEEEESPQKRAQINKIDLPIKVELKIIFKIGYKNNFDSYDLFDEAKEDEMDSEYSQEL